MFVVGFWEGCAGGGPTIGVTIGLFEGGVTDEDGCGVGIVGVGISVRGEGGFVMVVKRSIVVGLGVGATVNCVSSGTIPIDQK